MKFKIKTGHEVEEVSEQDYQRIHAHFPTYDGLVRLQPGNWFGLSTLPDILNEIFDFNFKPTDTIVTTYPKSGTTWMQEIVWTLQHNPDFTNPIANISIDIRAPQLELDSILALKAAIQLDGDSAFIKFLLNNAPHVLKEKNKFLAYLEWMQGARVIKSHLPLDLYPPKALETSKFIYLARDIRDVIVSKYHFFKVLKIHNFQGTLEDFLDLLLREEQMNHPFWEHVKRAYDLRDHPNLLFLYFEDLKADPLKVIAQISEFLGLQRTPEQIKNVAQYTDFNNMKKLTDEGKLDQPMSDGGKQYNDIAEAKDGRGFYRMGKSGTWKDSFSDDQIRRINEWTAKNLETFPDCFRYKSY